jgi:hypothetical protein
MAQDVNFTQTKKDLKQINKGLTDQISYATELGEIKNRYNKSNEREKQILSDVLDKTKEVMQNRKMLTDEQINSVDLHKLERKLIAEGLDDQVKMVQKLRQEYNIQKQINNTISQQAKMYGNIGNSIDGFVKKIPFIGDMLSGALGTDTLGSDMAESFRTALSQGGGIGEFGKNVGGEFGGGFLNAMMFRSETSAHRNAFSKFLLGGPAVAVATAASLGFLVSKGMQDGIESVGFGNTFKRVFFKGSFDALKDAFGNMGQSQFSTLTRLVAGRFRFGISAGDQAKILAAQVNISGASATTALNIQKSIAKSASLRGVLPADVFQDLANNTEQFATFAKDGGQNIGEAAIRARELGVSLDTVFKVSDGILDFQSSIENELKASLLIGRQLNLNEARRLAMAGDMAGLQEEILRQVGSEEQLMQMNAIQRKSLASALGVTVLELNKLASGELEVKNSDLKQNTDAMANLTKVLIAATAAITIGLVGRAGSAILSYARTQPGVSADIIKTPTGRFRLSGRSGPGFIKKADAIALQKSLRPKQLGMVRGALGAVAGPTGALIAIAGLVSIAIPILRRIRGNTEDTATNTKKSITGKNFSTPLYSSTVMQANIGNE